jgi:hypothetical protein
MEQPSKRAQFVHGMRPFSAHNHLHVNAPAPCRFAQSYMIASMLRRITLATNRRFGVVIYTAAAENQGTLVRLRKIAETARVFAKSVKALDIDLAAERLELELFPL